MLCLVLRHVFGCRKISNNLMIIIFYMFRETAKIDLMTNVGLMIDLVKLVPGSFTLKKVLITDVIVTH